MSRDPIERIMAHDLMHRMLAAWITRRELERPDDPELDQARALRLAATRVTPAGSQAVRRGLGTWARRMAARAAPESRADWLTLGQLADVWAAARPGIESGVVLTLHDGRRSATRWELDLDRARMKVAG